MATKSKPAVKLPAHPSGATPLELHALAIAAKEAKSYRSLLAVGPAQDVNLVVRLRGTVDVAAGQTSQVPAKPDPEKLLTLVLAHLGPETRTKIHDALVDCYPRFDELVDTLPAHASEGGKDLMALLTTHRTQERAGNVSGHIEITRLKR